LLLLVLSACLFTHACTLPMVAGPPPQLGLPVPDPQIKLAAAAAFMRLQLAVGDSPLNLSFQRLINNGSFAMGTPTCPITSGITVTVPGGNETFGVDNAGSYDVHGLMPGLTWTRIAATVTAGSTVLPLQEAVQWQPGDQIVLVTTTWKGEE
jgi:cell migration-inducing and hyaluronan-binding protein